MAVKNAIEHLLRTTKREGIENLITWMDENGFFNAPCSTSHHLCYDGGLAEHSLNVYRSMLLLSKTLLGEDLEQTIVDSIIICSLLHDIGKVGQFGKPYYTENYLSKTDKEGNPIRSETKPFTTNKYLLNIPHDVRSIAILSKFINLTEDEQFAILYHNGLYGDFKYQISGKETELYMLLHFADMWTSRVVEAKQPE